MVQRLGSAGDLAGSGNVRLVFFAAACLAMGCRTIDAASLDAQAPSLVMSAVAAVSVEPILYGAATSRIELRPSDSSIDRDAWSGELARLAETSLAQAGVPIGGDPRIRVQVVYLECLVEGPCLLDYNVTLGDVPARGYQARGQDQNIRRACREALETAVTQILRDPRIESFLRAP